MLNTAPTLMELDNLVAYASDGSCRTLINGEWVAARPYGRFSLLNRIKCAWLVFTGRADAVTWPGDQMPKAY